MNVLLSGIVGSTAYGLATEDSDIDRLGVYAAPSARFFGLNKVRETVYGTNPDRTLHEIGKWCRLALGGNPTVMELVWLPDDLYEVRTPIGDELINLRDKFLSAKRVRDAYLGYATQQFRKLESRGDGSFSADTRKRTAKHARHLLRLLHQGTTLYRTGRLTIRLDTPQQIFDFGERVAAGDLDAPREALRIAENAFDTDTTPLPEFPDHDAVNAWLTSVRIRLMTGTA